MPGCWTTLGRADARGCAPARVAFRTVNGIGTRDNTLSRVSRLKAFHLRPLAAA
jgi:hypothetical protein